MGAEAAAQAAVVVVAEPAAGMEVLVPEALAEVAAVWAAERADEWRMSEYVETGGLRWGQAFGQAANVSWPFARIRVSRERVHLTMKFWKIWNLTFDLEKSELQAIRKRHGLFSVGVQFEHRKGDYPPFLLFWTFREKTLFGELRRLGYNVLDTSTT